MTIADGSFSGFSGPPGPTGDPGADLFVYGGPSGPTGDPGVEMSAAGISEINGALSAGFAALAAEEAKRRAWASAAMKIFLGALLLSGVALSMRELIS